MPINSGTQGLPWLAVVAFGITGFYFLTNTKLDLHDKELLAIHSKLDEQKAALVEAKKLDTAEREKSRDVFLADSKATAAGIAELNKQTAVTSVQLIAIKDELAKIGQKLEVLRK